MGYTVKEIFYTLQGEGSQAGRPAVFCRFSGCNLWSGREVDRASAVCQFCDTEFVGVSARGGRFPDARSLASRILECWPSNARKRDRFVVCTGGEPLLQLDEALIDALHTEDFEIAVETNGTIVPPDGIDWICASPKAGSSFVLTKGHDLKLVFPQERLEPAAFEHLAFDNFLIQPMDGPMRARNTELAVNYCLAHPRWRLSLQTHKLLGIP